jgi:hypothetical protein
MRGIKLLNVKEFEKTTKQIPAGATMQPKARSGSPFISQPSPQAIQAKPQATR